MKLKNTNILFISIILLLFTAVACGLTSNVADILEVDSPTATPLPEILEIAPTPVIAGESSSAVDPSNQNTTSNSRLEDGMDLSELEGALIDLYNRVNPSVVHILVYASRNDPFPLGSGSGFIFDNEGRIVTNNHVVEGGGVYEVVFAEGSRRRAEVIGTDVDSDLAVIEVDSLPDGTKPVALGDSDSISVGQLVIAIGNPFGEQGSMSLGIISGLGRSLESQRDLDSTTGGRYSLPEVIQTDAPINPGNSGGPLLNMLGEVVGVNSAIRSSTGVNSGVGFSIPVNAVRRIIPTLIEAGEYIYSYMGVSIQSLNLNLQERFDLPRATGAYVTGITDGAPADESGLVPASADDGRGGDLILAINGEPIADTESLIAYLVFNTEVGETVELTVLRDDETLTVPLTLGARP